MELRGLFTREESFRLAGANAESERFAPGATQAKQHGE
jgi:hypothetical protein